MPPSDTTFFSLVLNQGETDGLLWLHTSNIFGFISYWGSMGIVVYVILATLLSGYQHFV